MSNSVAVVLTKHYITIYYTISLLFKHVFNKILVYFTDGVVENVFLLEEMLCDTVVSFLTSVGHGWNTQRCVLYHSQRSNLQRHHSNRWMTSLSPLLLYIPRISPPAQKALSPAPLIMTIVMSVSCSHSYKSEKMFLYYGTSVLKSETQQILA